MSKAANKISSYLLFEAQGAKTEQQQTHNSKDYDIDAEIGQMGTAENNGALQFNIISGWKRRANGIENPRHCLAWENKARKKY